MGVHKRFRKIVIASIAYDSRSGMIDIAFRTAYQLVGFFVYYTPVVILFRTNQSREARQ